MSVGVSLYVLDDTRGALSKKENCSTIAYSATRSFVALAETDFCKLIWVYLS